MILGKFGTNLGAIWEASWATIVTVLILLALYGFAYDHQLTTYRTKKYWEELYTPLAIGIYLIATMIGVAFILGVQTAFLIILCFLASGAPFVVSSLWRYRHQQLLREEFMKSNPTRSKTKPRKEKNNDHQTPRTRQQR